MEALTMPRIVRSFVATFAAALLLAQPSFAYNSPLSDLAVREAYFLGQRHDGSYARLLEKYRKFLSAPKTGPFISSIAFYTPFLQLVAYADGYFGNYSAQQAQIDYRKKGEETVEILVEIQLTESYGRMKAVLANSGSKSSVAFVPRPYDFWKDFEVHIFNGGQELTPADSRGHANYNCGRRGPCILIGATLQFDFPASAFTSDTTATIVVTPPEGNSVSVDFDLSSLR